MRRDAPDETWQLTSQVAVLQELLAVQERTVIEQSERLERTAREAGDAAQRIRAIVETIVDGVITISEEGRIESVNAAAARMFGYSSEELIDQNVKILMPEPYRSEHDQYLLNYRQSGEAKIIGVGRELVGCRKDGTTFPLDLAVGEMRVGGRRMFTGIVRDITERKEVERLKAEFVSTVSHELRTPLTSIRGSLGLLAGGVAGELPPEAREMIDIALTNSERLVRLINDILDIEKIESGRIEFRLKPMDVMAAVREAVEGNQGYAAQYRARVVIREELRGAVVLADPDRLAQVLTNLLSNAAKYSPPGEAIDVSVTRRDGGIRVSVRDRGPGISEEFKARIFQRFAQADASDTRRPGGTGLGLSIAKAIVERLGGRIGFEPALDRGTSFFFDLPEWREPDARAVRSRDGAPRVLVCEDDPDIALLLRKMIEAAGCEVDVAHGTAQARALLSGRAYDALTLDLVLGSEDGLVLLRELREQDATRRLPVVVVSARADAGGDELNGRAIGVIDWLSKPIDEACLVRAIRVAVREQRPDRARFLHVEDDESVRRVARALLGDLGQVVGAGSLKEARQRLASEPFDAVLLDLSLPDGDGLTLLESVRATPVVIFSATETSGEVARRVAATLVKSKATDQELRAVLAALIRRA